MDRSNYKEGLAALQGVGFTTNEIERLCRFRRAFVENEQEQAPADLARLRFIRWLVEKGKLTDQLA
jgi:hypothetical protein